MNRRLAGDVADTETAVVPAAEAERFARHRNADVHADHASAGTLGHASGRFAIASENGRRVAVRRIVLDRQSFVDAAGANDRQYRAEDLLASDLHLRPHVIDHRRPNIETAFAAGHRRPSPVD